MTHRMLMSNPMLDNPTLATRIYNGVDFRVGYPVILTKPIIPVTKKSWWKRVLGL